MAYTLMELCEANPIRFEAIAATIINSVPKASVAKRSRDLVRDLLIVRGGKAAAQSIAAAGLLARFADDIWMRALRDLFALFHVMS